MGQGRGSVGERVDIAWLDLQFSLYATPMLQHQAQLGLNPTLNLGINNHTRYFFVKSQSVSTLQFRHSTAPESQAYTCSVAVA